jgi:hypothetical protein
MDDVLKDVCYHLMVNFEPKFPSLYLMGIWGYPTWFSSSECHLSRLGQALEFCTNSMSILILFYSKDREKHLNHL